MLVLALVERGELALDRALRGIWPGIAAAVKAGLTLRMLLAHRSGLPGVRRPLPPEAMYDWLTMMAALACAHTSRREIRRPTRCWPACTSTRSASPDSVS